MPVPNPLEFRRRAVDLLAQRNPVAPVAGDLGSPSRSCAGGWSATTSMPAASRSLAAGCRIRGQHHGVAFDACVPKSEAS